MISINPTSIDDKTEDSRALIGGRVLTGIFGFYYTLGYPLVKLVNLVLDKADKHFYPNQYNPQFYKKFMDKYKLMTFGCLKTAYTGDLKHVWKYSRGNS